MWYAVAAGVWLIVGFAFCWLWGSLARFSGDDEVEGTSGEATTDEELEAAGAPASRRIIPFPSSRQAQR